MSTRSHTSVSGDPEAVHEIANIAPIVDLLTNPALGTVYLALLDGAKTVPELLEEVELTKSTVYDYVSALESAGVVVENGRKDGATEYTAKTFTFTLEIGGTRIDVTPDLVAVCAQRDATPEIGAFVDQYGIATLAAFVDRTYDHACGDITTRALANDLQISRGSAFDLLEHTYDILNIQSSPETFEASDSSDNRREALLDDSSEDY